MFAARILALLCALVGAPGLAHEDSLVEIGRDGVLKGLPGHYEPAKLVHNATVFRLRLGHNEVSLPPCLTSHLGLAQAKPHAYASWYHERSIFNGFSLLFNLETASLIEVTRLSVEGNVERRVAVNLPSLCGDRNV